LFCLKNIIAKARKRWETLFPPKENPDKPFRMVTFMYDHPNAHSLSRDQRQELLEPGLLVHLDQLDSPAPYSGDLMQAVEHMHAHLCRVWWLVRFRQGELRDMDAREAQLEALFYQSVTAESISANINKLWALLHDIVAKGTGEYSRPDLC